MTEREIAYLSIAEAARLVRERRLSPVDLVEAFLARTERLDGALRSTITVAREAARAQARAAADDVARGRIAGPLLGIPITYKDNIATAGIRTTAGSRVLQAWVPDEDAAVVRRLRAAGAVTLAKAALSEFTFAGGSTPNDFVKPPRNPWNPAHQAGGSSNGSAVGVAAGLATASVGGDSGGSIRIPAAFCGVTGLKPTYGRVSRTGAFPLSWSLDHVGPITRSVEDAALMLDAMCGPDPSDATTLPAPPPPASFASGLGSPVRGLRIGRLASYVEAVGLDRDTARVLGQAFDTLASLGLRTTDVHITHLVYASAAGYNTIMRAEAFQHHFRLLRDRRSDYGAAFRNIARGGFITAHDYLRAQKVRALIAEEVRTAFRDVDLLAMPVTPASPGGGQDYATEGSDEKVRRGALSHGAAYTAPFNLTGSPAISIPCGFNEAGVPIGLQLVGRAFDEATLLTVAHRFQQATDWHLRRPKEVS